MPPLLRLASAALILTTAALLGCKPAEESPRRADAASSTSVAPDRPGTAVPPPSGTVLVDEGAADAFGARAEATPAGPEAGDEPDRHEEGTEDVALAPEPELPVALTEERRRMVMAAVGAEAMERAREFNREGLRKHRRLDIEAALRDYRAALEAWPGYPHTNYNIACAYALTDRAEEALEHLAVLRLIGDEAARERLVAARLDADFDPLRGDPRFRALTGYVPITVTWSPGDDGRAEAERVAEALRASELPARPGRSPWRWEVSRPTLYVEGADPLARDMADALEAVTDGPLHRSEAGELGEGEGVVLVLPARVAVEADEPDNRDDLGEHGEHGEPSEEAEANGAGAAEGARDGDGASDGDGDGLPAAPVAVERPGEDDGVVDVGVAAPLPTLSDFVGRRLTADDGAGTVQRLHLKHTGFFDWEVGGPDGSRTTRTGRYALAGDALSLRYTERTEAPGPDPRSPTVTASEGLEMSPRWTIEPDGLRVGDVIFRAR